MPGEYAEAKRLIEAAMSDVQFEKNTMGQAIIAALIQHYAEYRPLGDIKNELQFTIDNLDEDEFVITRGC